MIKFNFFLVIIFSFLASCAKLNENKVDPYEPINRKTYEFNRVFDKLLLKPVANVYKFILLEKIRISINNAYNNVNMIPTVANDILQGEYKYVIKDTWRFLINSTFGIAGLFDVANLTFSLPPHSNDLGLTFAKWGDKNSPYIVIPFIGPSTIRDGMALMFEYTFLTPYPYINNDTVLYSLLAVRYVDLRSQLFENEKLMDQALDKYAFMRDVYLQYRKYRIQGVTNVDPLFVVDNNLGNNYVDE